MEQDRSQQLALLVDTVADYAIFLLDREGHVSSWNLGGRRLKGYTAEQIIGRHFSVFYTQEDRDRDHPAWELREALATGAYEEEGWRVRRDGSRFWARVTITALFDADGEHVGFGKVTRDMTARRLAEEQLRTTASELRAGNIELQQYRRMVEAVSDYAIFLLDPAGHVRTWNAGAQRIKGYAPEEIIGRHFSVFYPDEDRQLERPARELAIAAREGRYAEEGWRVRKDGRPFWAAVTLTAVHDDQGALSGYAKVTRDLTARLDSERVEAANEQLRRVNEELHRFAAIAAHDLSNPLRTISGFAELLERQELGGRAPVYVAQIRDTALRMSERLERLLSYAKAGEATEEPGPVEVAAAIERVLADLAAAVAQRGAQIDVAVPPDSRVLCTAGDLEIVLQNLVANAVKFADPDAPRVRVAAARADGVWRVSVSDNGIGISRADQERIFEPFERAAPAAGTEGTGLGLAICRRVVTRHCGAIGVESVLGEGSVFWFTLPDA